MKSLSLTSFSDAAIQSVRHLLVFVVITLFCFCLAGPSYAQWQFATIYSFPTYPGTAGGGPDSALIPAPDGKLYGTALDTSDGTIFEISPDGSFRTLYIFSPTTVGQIRGE
ncbi:MAG TPA: choice-of-anchor tandem repeat GloVer-containing protein [Capsulimonadaceae bacterium]|nr:choice-of-anchor tandem repeat GloVer-containing protein [Capsulimonadaceae bacterium]